MSIFITTKPVWSHVLPLSGRTLEKVHMLVVSCQEASPQVTNICMQGELLTFETRPDCIRYIIGVFCYNFKSQTNILASY